MHELLTLKKRLIKTVNPDINIVTDPTYKNENIDELLFKLQKIITQNYQQN